MRINAVLAHGQQTLTRCYAAVGEKKITIFFIENSYKFKVCSIFTPLVWFDELLIIKLKYILIYYLNYVLN